MMPSRENTRPSNADDATPKSTVLPARPLKSTTHTYLDVFIAIYGTLYSRYPSPTLPTDGGDFLRDFEPFMAGNDERYRARKICMLLPPIACSRTRRLRARQRPSFADETILNAQYIFAVVRVRNWHPWVRERATKIHMRGGAANINMFMVLGVERERCMQWLWLECLLHRLGGECREQFMLISAEAVRLIRARVIVCWLLQHDSALHPSQRDSLLVAFIRHNTKVNTDSVADGLKWYQYRFGGEGIYVTWLLAGTRTDATNASTLWGRRPILRVARPSDGSSFRGFLAGRLRGRLLVVDSVLAHRTREVHWNVMRPHRNLAAGRINTGQAQRSKAGSYHPSRL
ncbi:hypothetical protein C8R44DRAFT_932499 [Mycena epipterygia]|nr:hypothetical protein C8R44DRAFT_932499 [Mycena epipterygia]